MTPAQALADRLEAKLASGEISIEQVAKEALAALHATSQTPDAVREDQDWNIRKYIDFLRADEGDSVTLLCDNPDFNGQPNCAVECNGYWTNWQDRRFAADTLQGALELAYFECRQWRESPPPEVSPDLRSRVPAEKWTVGKNGWDASDEATREDI